MGGVVGGGGVSAVALGADFGLNGGVHRSFGNLYRGARAIFFVRSPDGARRLVTSTITRLEHTKAKTGNPPAFVPCASSDDNPCLTHPGAAMGQSQGRDEEKPDD